MSIRAVAARAVVEVFQRQVVVVRTPAVRAAVDVRAVAARAAAAASKAAIFERRVSTKYTLPTPDGQNLTQVAKDDTEAEAALRTKAVILASKGSDFAVSGLFTEAVGSLEEANRILTRVEGRLGLGPSTLRQMVVNNLLSALIELKEFDRSIEVIDAHYQETMSFLGGNYELLRSGNRELGADGTFLLKLLSSKGEIMEEKGDKAAAIECYTDALKQAPKLVKEDHPFIPQIEAELSRLRGGSSGESKV